MKFITSLFIFVFCISLVASAVIISETPTNLGGVVINPPQKTPFSNASFNGSYTDDNYLRRDGTNNMTGNLLALQNIILSRTNMTNISALKFNTLGCTDDANAGTFCWNNDKSTMNIVTGLGNIIQVGQETTYTIKNLAGKTIYAGQVISVNGSSGEIITGVLANSSNGELIHNLAMVTIPSCNNNAICQVTTIGEVNDLDTSTFTEGDSIYLDEFGNVTNVPINFPNYNIHLGTVNRVHATTGIITFQPEVDLGDGVVMNSLGIITNLTVNGFSTFNGFSIFNDGVNLTNANTVANALRLSSDIEMWRSGEDTMSMGNKLKINYTSLTTDPLTISGYAPNIKMEFQRSSGVGMASDIIDVDLVNTADDLSTQGFNLGIFGARQSTPTSPTLTYAWLGVNESTAYNVNHNVRFYPDQKTQFDGDTTFNANATVLKRLNIGHSDQTNHFAYSSTFDAVEKRVRFIDSDGVSLATTSSGMEYHYGSAGSSTRVGINAMSSGNYLIGTTATGGKVQIKSDNLVTAIDIDDSQNVNIPNGWVNIRGGTGREDLLINYSSTSSVSSSFPYIKTMNTQASQSTDWILSGYEASAGNDNVRGQWLASDGTSATFDQGMVIRSVTDDAINFYMGTTKALGIDSDENVNMTKNVNVGGNFTLEDTVWDDLRFPATIIKTTGASNLPVFDATNMLYDFEKDDQAYIIAQMPHSRKAGTDIEFHVHWSPQDAGAGNVVWGLEYAWANISGTFGAFETIYITDSADGVAQKHQYASNGAIDGSTKGGSSIIKARIFRNTTADTYGTDAGLLEVDFHYQIDKLGSPDETPII